jgi:hypothetical protein
LRTEKVVRDAFFAGDTRGPSGSGGDNGVASFVARPSILGSRAVVFVSGVQGLSQVARHAETHDLRTVPTPTQDDDARLADYVQAMMGRVVHGIVAHGRAIG